MKQELSRGSPLPSEYWIENPNPGNATQEWIAIWKKASQGDTATGLYKWYRVGKTRVDCIAADRYPEDGLPIIPYETWKAAVMGIDEYKVGDWVYVMSTAQSTGKVGVVGQISRIDRQDSMKIEGGTCTNSGKIEWVDSQDIRPATKDEIAKAQGVAVGDYSIEAIKGKNIVVHCPTQEEWDKVCRLIESKSISTSSIKSGKGWPLERGNTCIRISPSEALYSNKSWYEDEGHEVISASQFLMSNGQSVIEEGWKVGEELSSEWLAQQMTYTYEYDGTWKKWVVLNGHNVKGKHVKEIKDGWAAISETRTCWLPPKQGNIPQSTVSVPSSSIPVTQDNAVIGMKVVRGKDWKWHGQDHDSNGKEEVGTIVSEMEDSDWCQVTWPTCGEMSYRIGAENSYDLYIAQENTIVSKQVNNNLNNQKPTTNDKDNRNQQQDSSAYYIRSNPKVSQGCPSTGRKANTAIGEVKPKITEKQYREDKGGSGQCYNLTGISTGGYTGGLVSTRKS